MNQTSSPPLQRRAAARAARAAALLTLLALGLASLTAAHADPQRTLCLTRERCEEDSDCQGARQGRCLNGRCLYAGSCESLRRRQGAPEPAEPEDAPGLPQPGDEDAPSEGTEDEAAPEHDDPRQHMAPEHPRGPLDDDPAEGTEADPDEQPGAPDEQPATGESHPDADADPRLPAGDDPGVVVEVEGELAGEISEGLVDAAAFDTDVGCGGPEAPVGDVAEAGCEGGGEAAGAGCAGAAEGAGEACGAGAGAIDCSVGSAAHGGRRPRSGNAVVWSLVALTLLVRRRRAADRATDPAGGHDVPGEGPGAG